MNTADSLGKDFVPAEWDKTIAPKGTETLIDGGKTRLSVKRVRPKGKGARGKPAEAKYVMIDHDGNKTIIDDTSNISPAIKHVLDKRAERIKKTGEIFTPAKLVDEMIDKLEESDPALLKDPSKTSLDPAAGDGAFVTRLVDRKIKHGQTPIDALSNTFGIELMPDNAALARRNLLRVVEDNGYEVTPEMERIVKESIGQGDALAWDFDHWRPGEFQKDGKPATVPDPVDLNELFGL